MTFLRVSGSHLLKNTALGLLIAAGSTFAAVETASAIVPTPTRVCPDRIEGDSEFGGNGPRVIARVTNVYASGSALMADIYVRMRETKHNWTTARFDQPKEIWRDPSGRQITGGDTRVSSIEFTFGKNDHTTRTVTPDQGAWAGPVNRFEVTGDTVGQDVGVGCVGSWVYIHWNDIPVSFGW